MINRRLLTCTATNAVRRKCRAGSRYALQVSIRFATQPSGLLDHRPSQRHIPAGIYNKKLGKIEDNLSQQEYNLSLRVPYQGIDASFCDISADGSISIHDGWNLHPDIGGYGGIQFIDLRAFVCKSRGIRVGYCKWPRSCNYQINGST